MSYKVQLLVNGEASDPGAVTYQSIAKATQVAEEYVSNAIKKGWEVIGRTPPTTWVIEDEDGDQVRIVVDKGDA